MRNDETLSALRKLQRKVPEPQEAHGLLMLLGNGLAEATAGLRARQAALEHARARARGSAFEDDRLAEAEASTEALTAVRAEVRRLSVKEPRSGGGATGVYGHVLDDGEPVAGARVDLVDGNESLGCIETDKRGSFALSVDSEGPLGLQVILNKVIVHRDDEPTLSPTPVAPYRLVELGDSEPEPPTQADCESRHDPQEGDDGDDGDGWDDGDDGPTYLPKPGGTLTHALRDLKAADVPVAAVRLTHADDATARVSDLRMTGDGVELKVDGRVTDAGRLAVVAALLAYQPHAEAAGIGSATAAAKLLKAGQVTTWDEARKVSRLKIDDLARRFKLGRDQGTALRRALEATMSAIDVAEEE